MAILATAIEELRELVRGVHNGVLTERGLAPAWALLARRSPIDVEVFASSVPRLPAPIEASMYYLVSEALTNAARYGANRVRVDAGIWGDDGGKDDGWSRASGGATTSMVLTISDDGPGGADPARGTGLAGMSERVLALGGTVEIDSRPGEGTTLRVRVPVAGVRSTAGD
jgi:signal transduction histidine kinase